MPAPCISKAPPAPEARPHPDRAAERSTLLAVAVAGAGYIADYHLAVLRRLGRVEVVGACDPNAQRLEALCRQWSIPCGARSLEELLRMCRPQVVHVLVPPPFHSEVAEQALNAGAHVLIEKPMALHGGDCDRLAALAREQGVRLGVNHNAVFHPLYRRLRGDLAAGKLGKVAHVVAVQTVPLGQLAGGQHDHWMFQAPGNVLFEQGPHPFSQVCDLLGRVRYASTVCSGEQVLRGGQPFRNTWQIALTCERGTAQVLLSFSGAFPEAWLHVLGEDGSVRIDLLNNVYVLDRQTRYLEPVDRFWRSLNRARQATWWGMRGFTQYALSTLRLTGRSDPFYVSMRGSIAAYYAELRGESPEEPRADLGRVVIEGLEKTAAATAPSMELAERPPSVPPANARGSDILVLGGTGFIGRRLVAALHAAGHPIRLLVRRPALVPPELRACQPTVVPGDIRDAEAVRRAVAGCGAVIHLVSGAPTTWPEFEHLFVEGTRHVAEACLQAGVAQLLFVSSIAVYYLGRRRATITEATPPDARPGRRTEYTRAKIACEALLAELHQKRGLPVTVFRPGVVVGAGGPVEHSGAGYWPRGTHCISWGRRIHHGLPFVLVDDVAAALVSALGKEGLAGQSFNLVGEVRLSAAEYVGELRAASGRDIQLHRQSIGKWLAVDLFKWAVKAAARKPDNALPSLRDLRSRSLASAFDCSRAKQVLGWQPVADRQRFIELGIRQAVAGKEQG
jgi:predicted dehydrogenase/nucleoside-diphosphate-sugar epimerase